MWMIGWWTIEQAQHEQLSPLRWDAIQRWLNPSNASVTVNIVLPVFISFIYSSFQWYTELEENEKKNLKKSATKILNRLIGVGCRMIAEMFGSHSQRIITFPLNFGNRKSSPPKQFQFLRLLVCGCACALSMTYMVSLHAFSFNESVVRSINFVERCVWPLKVQHAIALACNTNV